MAKKVDLGLPALKPYLLNTDNIRKIFGDFISEEYEKAKISLFEKKVDDAQQIRTIEYYLNSRCSNLTLPENLGIKPGMAKRHLNDNLSNLEYYFGPGLEDRIREHKEEVTAIRMRCPRYLYIIETPELISIVRENLFYVKPEQFKSLLLCSKYLECKGDFELFNQTVNVTRNSLISNLKREVVLDLLNDEAKEKLLLYIEAEELLTLGDRIVEKREFIKKVVSTFALNRYDVDAVMNELNIPIEVLTRIVKDDMLTTYNLENMGKKIREIVLNYVPLEETTEKAKGK